MSRRRNIIIGGGVAVGTLAYLLRDSGGSSRAADRFTAPLGVVMLDPLSGVGRVGGVWNDARPARLGRHRGIDIGAPKGTRIRAIAPGIAIRVDKINDTTTGRHVDIETTTRFGKFWTRYLHLERVTPVVEGQVMGVGAEVGTVGDTGAAKSPHLHLDIWASPGVLARYKSLFGSPSDGYPAVKQWRGFKGVAIPAEALVPTRYRDSARERALKRRVVIRPEV